MNPIPLRRRKNFFDCEHAQKERNKNLIKAQSATLNAFCRSIGLKIHKIILNRNEVRMNDFEIEKSIKVFIESQNLTNEEKAFKFLKAKDESNLSQKKYRIIRKAIMDIETCNIMGIKSIDPMKQRLNNFFRLENNEKGFYLNPIQKIIFVCRKFLEKKPEYDRRIFRIKLCCDGVALSSTKVNMLNFSFNLLDDETQNLNVLDTYILGCLLIYLIKE
jgi:hypothetical protein